MSNLKIKISDLQPKLLPILSDKEAGEKYNKWSFMNIYSLKDLRDIYLTCLIVEDKTLRNITKYVNEYLSKKNKWEERHVLEYLNALVKFGLLDTEYIVKVKCFEDSHIGQELSYNDCITLKSVFFRYFRFKELSSWFINTEKSFHATFEKLKADDYVFNSKPLYFFSERNRFTDSFILNIDNITDKFIIENDSVMRFWDVYLKWGTSLGILEKFNLSKVKHNINTNKEISMVYFIIPFQYFDLKNFIINNFQTRHILIPQLIFEIAKKYRYSVTEIKSFIVSEILGDDRLTYERTSEIFIIKGNNSKKNIGSATYLFPKINNSYISHLILRK